MRYRKLKALEYYYRPTLNNGNVLPSKQHNEKGYGTKIDISTMTMLYFFHCTVCEYSGHFQLGECISQHQISDTDSH